MLDTAGPAGQNALRNHEVHFHEADLSGLVSGLYEQRGCLFAAIVAFPAGALISRLIS